jgi:hypothetical protein
LKRRLDTFRRKEATEKDAAEKEAVEEEAAEKEAAEEDDDELEDQHALPPKRSNDDGPVSAIRFPRVKCWLKCPPQLFVRAQEWFALPHRKLHQG